MNKNAPLSASQVSTYALCARKWGWDKLEKIPRKEHPSTALGSHIHSLLEHYLKTGVIPDPDTLLHVEGRSNPVRPGAIAQSGIRHLPPPGSGVVEAYFKFEWEGVWWRGYIDWSDLEAEIPRVLDHKTTGDLKWMKTPSILERDPQATIYAAYTMQATGKEHAQLDWVYYLTKGSGRSKVSSLLMDLDTVNQNMRSLTSMGIEMIQAKEKYEKKALTVLDLEPNLGACGAFGGCDYQKHCELTFKDKIKSMFEKEEKSMGLREMMAERKAQQAKEAGEEAPKDKINPPAVKKTPKGGHVKSAQAKKQQSVLEKLRAKKAEEEARLVAEEEARLAAEAEEEEATSEEEEEAGEAVTAEELALMDRDDLKELAIYWELVDSSSKLGDKSLRKLLLDHVGSEAPEDEEEAPEDEEEAPEDEEEAPEEVESALPVLLVGCLPSSGGSYDLSAVINEANQIVCDLFDVTHYAHVEYGKGKGHLCSALTEILNGVHEAHNHQWWYVDRGTPSEFITELAKHVQTIIFA